MPDLITTWQSVICHLAASTRASRPELQFGLTGGVSLADAHTVQEVEQSLAALKRVVAPLASTAAYLEQAVRETRRGGDGNANLPNENNAKGCMRTVSRVRTSP